MKKPTRWNLGNLIDSILGSRSFPLWPPDLFAVTATILAETGGYVHATHLGSGDTDDSWHAKSLKIASKWTISNDLQKITAPKFAKSCWREVCAMHSVQMSEIAINVKLCMNLIMLLALADTASAGFGIDMEEPRMRAVLRLLAFNEFRSLTKAANPDRARVLPKQHTPQNGLTLRSLSHHLALIRPRGVLARWTAPLVARRKSCDDDIINALICPWPQTVSEKDFRTVNSAPDHEVDHHAPHRFFAFDPPDSSNAAALEAFECDLRIRITDAEKACGDIHLLVFPELALCDEKLRLARRLAYDHGLMLVAGVRHADRQTETDGHNLTRNSCFVDSTGLWARDLEDSERAELQATKLFTGSFQDKHHRWSLDWRQVIQYGLGSRLPTSRQCWEWTPIRERRLHFWTISKWLTWAPLICEDLARQDPVADIIRSVAPNLVIALLMDGPQIRERWSARFATVLAEDPGSSVLTVTCLGMAVRSLGPGGKRGTRTIALWRDSLSGIHELALPDDCDSGVLSISPVRREEWSADGRSDGGVSSTPVFAGFTPILGSQSSTAETRLKAAGASAGRHDDSDAAGKTEAQAFQSNAVA